MLPEPEAFKLAVVFEEISKFHREQMRKAENKTPDSGTGSGAGWEEVWSFGGDDPNDYWTGTDLVD